MSVTPLPTPVAAKRGSRQKRVVGINAALSQSMDVPAEASGAVHLDRGSNLHDAAYERMRQALMDGHFVPGQTFTIRALAAVFGTSPMPVRDALKRLVAERALELRPNRSVVLPIMSRARFLEILQIRLSLESMIAARAATKVTPAEIEAMAEDHRQMCEALDAADPPRFLACNRRLHFRLYEAAQTQVLLPIIESLWMQIGPHLNHLFRTREQPVSTVAMNNVDHHHTDLLRALRRQDPQAAAKAVWDDLSDAADAILAADDFEG